MNRKNFLKNTAILGMGILLPHKELFANLHTLSTVTSARIETMPKDGNLPKGFKRFYVYATINNKEKRVGSFFAMENTADANVGFIGNTSNGYEKYFNPIAFDKIKTKIETPPNVKLVMSVAAAFTNDWSKANDYALSYGKTIGERNEENYTGFLLIKNGKPEIRHKKDLLKKYGEKSLKDFVNKNKDNKDISHFQQQLLIYDGNINPGLTLNDSTPFEWRYFVQRKTPTEDTFGMINFDESLSMKDSIDVLLKLNNGTSYIKNALRLDMGPVSLGYFYDKEGNSYKMLDEKAFYNDKITQENLNLYTNILTFYSKQ